MEKMNSPLAGFSMKKSTAKSDVDTARIYDDSTDDPDSANLKNGNRIDNDNIEENEEENSWKPCDGRTFSLRIGPNYNKNKLKAPSAKELYDIVGVDLVKTSSRIDNIGSKVSIPKEWDSIDTFNTGVPPVFIVNTQLPSNFSTSFFTETTDGDGWSLVTYFKISQDTLQHLSDLPNAPPAIKLFAQYCNQAPGNTQNNPPNDPITTSSTTSSTSSPSSSSSSSTPPDESSQSSKVPAPPLSSSSRWFSSRSASLNNTESKAATSPPVPVNPAWVGRFKVTIRCENIEKFNLPSFISSYNAKPVLIRNTGTLIRSPDGKYIEMDINVHRFASVPKKALEVMFNRFYEMIISVGFCIESRDDNEMPEVLFGCVTICRPSSQKAIDWGSTLLPNPTTPAGAALTEETVPVSGFQKISIGNEENPPIS